MPPNSFDRRPAVFAVSGKRDLPDMYISLPDMMSPGLSTGRVFVSFTPNERPALSAAAMRRLIIGTASSNCRSSLKWRSPNETYPNPIESIVSLASLYPRMVGFILTKVFSPFSFIRYDAIRSISSGGHPCSVESVIELQTLEDILSIWPASIFSNFVIFA